MYAYVQNDPINTQDPAALRWAKETICTKVEKKGGKNETIVAERCRDYLFWLPDPPSGTGRARGAAGDRTKPTPDDRPTRPDPPHYVCTWELGPASETLAAEKAMSIIQSRPNDIFPFQVQPTAGLLRPSDEIRLGHEYDPCQRKSISPRRLWKFREGNRSYPDIFHIWDPSWSLPGRRRDDHIPNL